MGLMCLIPRKNSKKFPTNLQKGYIQFIDRPLYFTDIEYSVKSILVFKIFILSDYQFFFFCIIINW